MSEILIYLHSIRLFGIEDNGTIGISSYCGINIWQCKPNAMGNRILNHVFGDECFGVSSDIDHDPPCIVMCCPPNGDALG